MIFSCNFAVCSRIFRRFRWSLIYAAAATGSIARSTSRSLTTSGRFKSSRRRWRVSETCCDLRSERRHTVWIFDLMSLRGPDQRELLAANEVEVSSVPKQSALLSRTRHSHGMRKAEDIHPFLIGRKFPLDEAQNLLSLLRYGRQFPQRDLEIEHPARETISVVSGICSDLIESEPSVLTYPIRRYLG